MSCVGNAGLECTIGSFSMAHHKDMETTTTTWGKVDVEAYETNTLPHPPDLPCTCTCISGSLGGLCMICVGLWVAGMYPR